MLLVAGAMFFVLGGLGASNDPWRDDEAFSYDLSRNSTLGSIVEKMEEDCHPPLFYCVLAFWLRVFPDPQTMKVMTLMFGLASLLAAAVAGRLLGGPRTGVLVGLLWASFPMLLHYSQDVRMYTMALFFQTLAIVGWLMAPRRPRLGWIIFVFSMLASLYTHNLCLVFAAALIGAEILRCFIVYSCAKENNAQPDTGLRWILSASFMIGLLYIQWLPHLWRQMHLETFVEVFKAHRWDTILQSLFVYPYTLLMLPPGWVWTWIPGILLLAIIPLLHLISSLRRVNGHAKLFRESRPLGMFFWISAAPLAALILYSKYFNPMFETHRHGLLFLPFLLFPTAFWLADKSHSRAGRGAALTVVACCGLLAVSSLSRPRDFDRSAIVNTMLDRAPLNVPVFIYPGVPRFVSLCWQPMPLYPYMKSSEVPADLTDCALVLLTGRGLDREEIKHQAKRTLAKAVQVKEVYVAYDMAIYLLHGLPSGELRSFLDRRPGLGIDTIGQQVGPWQPTHIWSAKELASLSQPPGDLIGLSGINTAWQGMRLRKPHTTLRIPLGDVHQGYGAVMIGGRYHAEGRAIELTSQLGPGKPHSTELRPGDFTVMKMVSGAMSQIDLSLQIPHDTARLGYVPKGDVPVGFYLIWGGYLPLTPERFRQPGFAGIYFDVGALGDDLYLRQGFHEAEGMPPAEHRWTKGEFDLEVPVFPGEPCQEIILRGILPVAIKDRRVQVEVKTEGDATKTLSVECLIDSTDYGEHALRLPASIPVGVQQLHFKLGGTWSPKENGQGSDPRQLGFFLDGVGLR